MPKTRLPNALIIFDGDDTLWLVEPLYEHARKDVRNMLRNRGLDPDMWESIERTLDLDRFGELGFSTDRFPGSCVLAYEELADTSGRPVDIDLTESIRKRALRVFSERAPLAEGAVLAVQDLAADHTLMLLTQGDKDVQEKRVQDSGLAASFAHIEITPRKDDKSFRKLIKLGRRPASGGWSIGNSMASDIEPALRCGLRGILVRSSHWEFEDRAAPEMTGHWFSVHSLVEAVDRVRGEIGAS